MDAAGLAVFRIGFGVISAWEIWRAYDGNQIAADYDVPRHLFRWWAFEWVKPAPGRWLYIAFAIAAIAALFVAAGLFYRVAAVVHFLGITYWFLMEKANYLNHRYLTVLFAFLLIFVPAHALWSVDARRKPWVRSESVSSWALWLLRVQVALPYFFSGVAKLNHDWLVRGEPLRTWLADQTDFPVIGALFTQEWIVRAMGIGSTLLDLSMPFLLLYRRTRTFAFALAVAFHFMNARLFEIGIFPWMMIVATTLFFDPDWPRRMVTVVRRSTVAAVVVSGAFVIGFVIGGFLPKSFVPLQALIGGAGVAVLAFHLLPRDVREADTGTAHTMTSPWRGFVLTRAATGALIVWVAVQALVPFRHFLIPGNVQWTEEGQRFSWHLLVQSKRFAVRYEVTDPNTGRSWIEDPRRHLTTHQISKLNDPDLLLQFARYLDYYYRRKGRDVEVRAEAVAQLNGRPAQHFVEPFTDLSSVRRPYIPPAAWIVQLEPI